MAGVTTFARAAIEAFALAGIYGSVLAVLGFAVVRAGRLRPSWQAAVWLVVLAKFVLPWGPALPWSLADLVAGLTSSGGAEASVEVAATAAVAPPPAPSAAWLVLALAWLGGASTVLALSVRGQLLVLRAARRAELAPQGARALLAGLARRPPRLVVGDPAVGPHVVGLLRPIIVVPPALLSDEVLLRAALLHELAHIRRRDALARWIQVLACAVFFFWPVVRLVSRRLDLAREAACDAWALEASGVARPSYARLLVRMAQLRTANAASLAAARGLDARVAAVLGPPAQARRSLVHGLALVLWVAVALGGARSAEARGEHVSCKYTPQLADALLAAHPEADLDGDGVISREEACEYQAGLRRWVRASEVADPAPRLDAVDGDLLSEPLCCNCSLGAEDSAPWLAKPADACPADEGVSR